MSNFIKEFKNYLYEVLNKEIEGCLKAVNFDESKINRDEKGRFASKLYAKLKQMEKDYKNGEYNPKRYKGKVVEMNNLEGWEREYVYSKINSDLSDKEKEIGITTRRLYNRKLKRDYLYLIRYDKNGKHNITRYYIDDDIY